MWDRTLNGLKTGYPCFISLLPFHSKKLNYFLMKFSNYMFTWCIYLGLLFNYWLILAIGCLENNIISGHLWANAYIAIYNFFNKTNKSVINSTHSTVHPKVVTFYFASKTKEVFSGLPFPLPPELPVSLQNLFTDPRWAAGETFAEIRTMEMDGSIQIDRNMQKSANRRGHIVYSDMSGNFSSNRSRKLC